MLQIKNQEYVNLVHRFKQSNDACKSQVQNIHPKGMPNPEAEIKINSNIDYLNNKTKQQRNQIERRLLFHHKSSENLFAKDIWKNDRIKTQLQSENDELRKQCQDLKNDLSLAKKRNEEQEAKIGLYKKKIKKIEQQYYHQKSQLVAKIEQYERWEIEKNEQIRKKQIQHEAAQQNNAVLVKIAEQFKKLQSQFTQCLELKDKLHDQRLILTMKLEEKANEMTRNQQEYQKIQTKMMSWMQEAQQKIKVLQEEMYVKQHQMDKLYKQIEGIQYSHSTCDKRITTLKHEIITKQKQFECYKIQSIAKLREYEQSLRNKDAKIIELKQMIMSRISKVQHWQQKSKIQNKIQKLGDEINELKSIETEFPNKKHYFKMQSEARKDRRFPITTKNEQKPTFPMCKQ